MKRLLSSPATALAIITTSIGGTVVPAAEPSSWHGFERTHLEIEGHAAFVTRPKIAAPGKPWVWRTSFPDFHAEIDRELLAQGWHVAFIDCVYLLGSDPALDLYDRFYEQVRRDFGLAERPALEAVSRGAPPDRPSWKPRPPFGDAGGTAHHPRRPTKNFPGDRSAPFRLEGPHPARHFSHVEKANAYQ